MIGSGGGGGGGSVSFAWIGSGMSGTDGAGG